MGTQGAEGYRRGVSRPNRLVLSLTVVASLALTACQDDSEPSGASLPSSSSTSGVSAPTPVGESPSVSPSLDAASVRFLDRMRRGMGRSGTAHLELRVSGRAATTSSGDMRYGRDGSEIALTTRTPALGSGALRMVVLHDAAFVSIPGLVRAGTFIKVGRDDPRFARLAGASLQLSPDQSLKAFRAGLISARPRGRDTVQGVPTTQYDVRADSVRALQAQGSDAVPGMPGTLTYQVWLDGQDRMRRLALSIQGTRLVMELSRWGAPVSIAAPPKADLVAPPPGF